MTNDDDVAAVNVREMRCITDTGVELVITEMFDADGDETDDPDQAASIVARDPRGQWWAIDLSQFDSASIH